MIDFDNFFNLSAFKNKFPLKRLLGRWRLMNFRKFLYLSHILNQQEKRLILFLIFAVLLGGGGLLARSYLKITKPIPGVGKTYTEGMLKEPRAISPLYAAQDADRDLTRLIYASLFSYSGEGKLLPDMAEKYEISPDGKSYTVTLKKNIFWHDGQKVSADDVVFTVKTVQNPQYKSVARANWQGVSAEKLNQDTVRFTLRAPYAPFVENLTLGILPKHLWENISPEQALLHELNLKPVGSGPYKFDSFKQAADGSILWYEIIRNPRYHRGGPYFKKIIFTFFKTEDEMLSALSRGLIDGFGPVSSMKLSELDQTQISVRAMQMPRLFSLFFNEKKNPVLADKKIRRAMERAINKVELAKRVTAGGAVPAFSPLPFLTPEAEDKTGYDPDEARKILDETGWKSKENGGIREKRVRGKGKDSIVLLHFKLTTADTPEFLRAAEFIKRALREIGADIEIEKKSFNDLEEKILRPRNFEILLFGQVYGFEADPFTFWHSSQVKDPGLNVALYSNKKVDQILEETRRIADPAARKKKYEEFSKLVLADTPAIFLYNQLYLYLLPADVMGMNLAKISLPADRFNEINTWYRTTKRVLK